MRLTRLKVAALGLLLTCMLSSCETMMPNPDTITTEEERISARNKCVAMYTVGGGLAGALAGGLIGGNWRGAGIGAAAGGAIGFAYAWGKCLPLYSTLKSQQAATYSETAQSTGYTPSQGNVTKIASFSVSPSTIQPGGSATLDGSYYVMAPEGAKEMKVTETRSVKYFDPSKNQWTDLGAVDQQVTAAPGFRKAAGSFDVPKDVPEGNYKIAFKVSAGGKEDATERDLTVKKGVAMGETRSLVTARTP